MKQVLLLTPQLPNSPIRGGMIKTCKMLEFLLQHYEFTLACRLP